jgi:hypothetical protein
LANLEIGKEQAGISMQDGQIFLIMWIIHQSEITFLAEQVRLDYQFIA